MKKALILIASLFALSVVADDHAAPATAEKHEETTKVETKAEGNKKMKKTKKEVKKTEEHKEEAHH